MVIEVTVTDPTDADREAARKALCEDCDVDTPVGGMHVRSEEDGGPYPCPCWERGPVRESSRLGNVTDAIAAARRQERERCIRIMDEECEIAARKGAGPRLAAVCAADRMEADHG